MPSGRVVGDSPAVKRECRPAGRGWVAGAYESLQDVGWLGGAYESLQDVGVGGRGLRASVPEDCQVVRPDVVQQDPCSLLQGLQGLLQALSPTLAFPEHWVRLQRLEQHIL